MKKEIQQLIDALRSQGEVSLEDLKKRRIITLSKVAGAGGKEIAKIIADRLDLKIYDRTIITELAEYTGTDKEAFSIIADVAGDSKDFWLYRIFGGGEVSHETIRRHLTNVIQALARTSDCLLVGRGAHIALKDVADIRIRITAPMETCVERIMAAEKCNREAATAVYKKETGASGKFTWSVFSSRLNDPTNFDLIINTEKISDYETCADIIIDALGKIQDY